MQEEHLEKQFKEFTQIELFSLSELVDFYLSKDPLLTKKYDKKFFTVLTAYSFIQTNLNILEHGMPSIYISNVLDRFATRHYTQGITYFVDVAEELDSLITWTEPKLLEFCDNFIFFRGLYPEAFNKRITTPSFYERMAKNSFSLLRRKPEDIYSAMSNNLERYIHALNYMSQELLEGKYLESNHSLSRTPFLT